MAEGGLAVPPPGYFERVKGIANGWPLGAFISRSEARSAERA